MIIELVYTALFGLALGSFANNIISHYAFEAEFDVYRSKCFCGKENLGLLELIPVLSYSFQRGKCIHCGVKIPSRYLFIEVIYGSFAMLIYYSYGFTLEGLINLVFISALILIGVIDYYKLIIPNILTVVILTLGVIKIGLYQNEIILAFVSSLLLALPVYLLGKFIKKRKGEEALGFGDVKLIFAASLFCGFPVGFIGVWLGSVVGVITAGVNTALGNKKNKYPFGLYLAVGYITALLMGEWLLMKINNFII